MPLLYFHYLQKSVESYLLINDFTEKRRKVFTEISIYANKFLSIHDNQ